MIGIVLAGGSGTRLYPLTAVTSKQLLPVYDKPMIYYPVSTLMLAGIRDIIVITTPQDQSEFKRLLGDGKQFGVNFNFLIQEQPKGLAEAFLIAEPYIASEKTALVLGDNIFHGSALGTQLTRFQKVHGAQIFGYHVSNPSEYGVVSLNADGSPIKIQEKPIKSESNLAIPGLYFYDETVLEKARKVTPSVRGELEITSINQMYLEENGLKVEILPRGTAWLDTGSHDSLFEASSYVKVLEERQGLKIGCLEEIAWRNGWITDKEIHDLISQIPSKKYASYLFELIRR
jgi:glucose-1-phosphate thymidylyltransferase